MIPVFELTKTAIALVAVCGFVFFVLGYVVGQLSAKGGKE